MFQWLIDMIAMSHNLIDKYGDKVYNGNFVMIRKINVDAHILILQCFEYFMEMVRWKLIKYVNVNYVILDHCALICMHSYIVSLNYWRLSWVCRKFEPWKLFGETRFNPCEHGKAKVNIWKIQNLIVLCLFCNVIVHGCYKLKNMIN